MPPCVYVHDPLFHSEQQSEGRTPKQEESNDDLVFKCSTDPRPELLAFGQRRVFGLLGLDAISFPR